MSSPEKSPVDLGRGAVIDADQPVPAYLEGVEVFDIDKAAIDEPSALVARMHGLWATRTPYVARLHVGAVDLKALAMQTETRPLWELGDRFSLDGQRLHFLIWNNNWDHRSGEPVWWWANKACNIGATPSDEADVVLPDGTHAWVDGGPLEPRENTISYIHVERGSVAVLRDVQSKSELAPDQREAVEHRRGASRIIAPAGSGKTRVLTERLRHLLSGWGIEAGAVCAVAYNTRAARELTERTQGVSAHIRTLNSIAFAIVNGSGGFAQSSLESQRRDVLDEPAVRRILQDMVEVPRRSNTDPYAAWIEALSAARLGLIDPSVVEDTWDDVDGFADVFARYRAYLDDHGVLDFDDQIYRAIEILLRDPKARLVAQKKCRILLVDEFQDLTPAHMLMLRLLAAPALDVFGVGDDDQVIYGYAGAKPDYLVSFDQWFPGAGSHSLEVNYRCPPSVVEAANNTLTRNAVRVAKQTRPAPGRDDQDGDLSFATTPEPATRSVDTITDWLGDCPASEIAVLARVNVALLPVQVLLAQERIPHIPVVGASVLDRTGMRSALAYLRMGNNPDSISRSDVMDTVRRPSRKIARNVVDMMVKRRSTSVSQMRQLAGALSGNDAQRVLNYAADITRISDAIRAGGTEAALKVIKTDIGLSDTMDTLDGSRREVDRSTHGDDLAALSAVAHLHSDASTFEPWLREVLSRSSADEGVELSTVHRVKGREWRRVIVYGADAELMPHRLSSDRAEERRVFHVAITRCRERCMVVASNPSPFIGETAEPGEAEKPAPVRTREERPTRAAPGLAAEVGMTVTVAGSEVRIIELTDNGAMASVGKAQTMVPYGTVVTHQGKNLALMAPRSEKTQKAFEALKEWRYKVSRENKMPAYTVLHDSHLEGIAEMCPRSLEELASCKGVGPSKLDRYGDEILAVIEQSAS